MLMKRFVGSMESIAFQGTQFLDELANMIAAVQELPKKDIPDSSELASIAKIIKNHTKLTCTVTNRNVDGAYVEIPQVDKNHPFIHNYLRNYTSSATGLRMINDADGLIRGGVDLIKGEVFGVFEDIPHNVVLGDTLFTKKYTAHEAATVLQHEIGHLMTYYEYITRTVTTNQILAGMSKALDESGDVPQREAVLVSVKKKLKLKDLDVQELAKSTNKKVVEVVVISNIAKETASELGNNVYDTSTWEMLADQYVARNGGSRHLVSALDKLYRGHWNISFRSLPAYLAFEALKLLLVVAPGIMIVLMAMDGQGDGTYDTPGARFKRVRNQIVENLKDKSLTEEDVDRLKADIAAVDEILEGVNDRRQFIGVLWDNVSPSARRARSYTELQKELEEIAANDLFTKAASLRQL